MEIRREIELLSRKPIFGTSSGLIGKRTMTNTSQVNFNITDEYCHYLFHGESCTFFTSSIFLIATFVVYAILPEIRNTSGVNVMCYVASLALALISTGICRLCVLHVDPENTKTLYYIVLCK